MARDDKESTEVVIDTVSGFLNRRTTGLFNSAANSRNTGSWGSLNRSKTDIEMFQDYCMAHGEVCTEGSLYCSDDCRDQDVFGMFEADSIENEPAVETGGLTRSLLGYLLYDCVFCQTRHEPHEECAGYSFDGYTWDSRSSDLFAALEPRSDTMLETLQQSELNRFDPLTLAGNDFIQSNYRKWVLNISPR